MDVLSDVLSVVRLTGAMFFTAETSSPWAVTSPPPDQLRRLLAPRAECMALFHILVDGETCWVALDGLPPLRMAAGDLIILPHGDRHLMASHLEAKSVPMDAVLLRLRLGKGMTHPRPKHGGGARSRLVCG